MSMRSYEHVLKSMFSFSSDLISSFIFVANYGGKDCEIESICQDNVCMNGGVCQTIAKDVFKCFCGSDYAGDRCEYSKLQCVFG